jgi:hypothetical protein
MGTNYRARLRARGVDLGKMTREYHEQSLASLLSAWDLASEEVKARFMAVRGLTDQQSEPEQAQSGQEALSDG